MDRSIKFRAWCSNSKELAFVDRIDFSGKYVWLLAYEGEEDQAWLEKFRDVILIQYTGQKDKKGIEIYEGDILGKTSHWELFVGFRNGKFILHDTNLVRRNNDYTYDLHRKVCEGYCVIGNIYENPELMEGANK